MLKGFQTLQNERWILKSGKQKYNSTYKVFRQDDIVYGEVQGKLMNPKRMLCMHGQIENSLLWTVVNRRKCMTLVLQKAISSHSLVREDCLKEFDEFWFRINLDLKFGMNRNQCNVILYGIILRNRNLEQRDITDDDEEQWKQDDNCQDHQAVNCLKKFFDLDNFL